MERTMKKIQLHTETPECLDSGDVLCIRSGPVALGEITYTTWELPNTHHWDPRPPHHRG
jgi:hypothetical protein